MIEVPRIEIVPYARGREELKNREISRLRSFVGPAPIEHVGSSSVLGLAGKPVIDLLVGTTDPRNTESLLGQIEAAGYTRGGPIRDAPEVFFFERSSLHSGMFHLHASPHLGQHWRDLVAFRDALRSSTTLMHEYEALKRALASRYAENIDEYAAGKSDFVAQALRAKR